jgi:hypothetical protein
MRAQQDSGEKNTKLKQHRKTRKLDFSNVTEIQPKKEGGLQNLAMILIQKFKYTLKLCTAMDVLLRYCTCD